jgi:hypothetical protein
MINETASGDIGIGHAVGRPSLRDFTLWSLWSKSPILTLLHSSLLMMSIDTPLALMFRIGGHGKLSKDPLLEGVIRKPANDAEIVFYQTLNGDDAQLSTVPTHIRAFFPQFHGVSDKSACNNGA